MPGLNENHKRRLFAALQYADDLLSQALNAVTPARQGLYARTVQDMSPSELLYIENHFGKIREQISALLERFEIPVPAPSTPASWILKTHLMSLDIAFEELHPDRLRGYGEMDPSTARELAGTLQEIRRLLSQLFAFLSEADGVQE